MEFGVFFPKRTEFFPLKDYKGHLVKKSSFKGLFEIKDSRTYTGPGSSEGEQEGNGSVERACAQKSLMSKFPSLWEGHGRS